MKPENIEFLDANRHHYNTLVNAGYIQHFDQATRQGILNVIHAEFNPGYIASLWCQSCIAEMLTYAYVQYDKWIEANKLTEAATVATEPMTETISAPTVEPERDHVRMTFPIMDPPEATVPEPPPAAAVRTLEESVKPAPSKVDGTLFGQQKGNTKPVTDAKPVGGPPPAGAKPPKRRR